jgi:large subunit ribosomal protein L4
MLTARYFNAAGEPAETFELPQDLFDGVVNEPVLHQAVKAYLANQRQGTSATKTRGNVSGGSRKIGRQKGTGRARQGSIRAPHWRGGGVAFGPTPRSYRQELPRKVRALARRSAFNSKALSEKIAVIERFELEAPKTRLVAQLLSRMDLNGRKYLLLTDGVNESLVRSARNLPNVRVLPFVQASVYDVLNNGHLVIEKAALEAVASEAETEVAHA